MTFAHGWDNPILFCDGWTDDPDGKPFHRCPSTIAVYGPTVPDVRYWAQREGWNSYRGRDQCPVCREEGRLHPDAEASGPEYPRQRLIELIDAGRIPGSNVRDYYAWTTPPMVGNLPVPQQHLRPTKAQKEAPVKPTPATHRRAVVVFLEVDDAWDDPHNVGTRLVETALSGDPRGMLTPYELTRTVQGAQMSATITEVCDLSEAMGRGLLHVTPAKRAYDA